MIAVSNAWKDVQNQTLLPEVFVEITYEITEPGLQEEATASANYPEDFSDVAQIVNGLDKNSEKYAMLDYGCWGLDGGFGYSDGTPTDPGYVDENYSEADGTMSVYPKITIDFAKRHSFAIPGITITWSNTFGGWATDFRVNAYNSNGMVATTTVYGNTSVVTTVELNMVEYSQITIEILKWSHPFQRVKCSDIALGIKAVYTKTDLLGYNCRQSVDLLSAKLPENEVKFKLRNDDGRWNPEMSNGVERYLLEQQEIRVRYGMDINGTVEWIEGGTFWLSEWNTPTNGLEADFTARGATEFMFGAYSGPREGTLYDIAVAALDEADLPLLDDGTVRYVVDESLKYITTDFSAEDTEYAISEVLQMVAHVGCCVFYQDRAGRVIIAPRSKSYSNYRIDKDISYAHPEYTISKPLKAVSVEYGSDKQSVMVEVSSRGEIQTVQNPFIVTKADAQRVGETAAKLLENRKVVSGDFRADMRMDALDNVMVISKYASNIICMTDVEYSTTNGAFRGKYTGRVVSVILEPVKIYSGEFYVGEFWNEIS
jgi:hypothetical protein